MSFASGIDSLQQAINSSAPSNAKPVVPANRPESVAVANAASIEHADNLDQADLSSAGGVVTQALEGSDIRSEKVASLQQAIAAGTYNVSSSDVADKIIEGLSK
jgi:negative regulator of flagellin synthesis FlgM